MNINLENRLYKVANRVYFGYTALNVHNQRGRYFIRWNGKQINIKEIPILPIEKDCVFEYILNGLSVTHPCIAMDYWIYRWRLGNKISIKDYKLKFNL